MLCLPDDGRKFAQKTKNVLISNRKNVLYLVFSVYDPPDTYLQKITINNEIINLIRQVIIISLTNH